MLNAPNEIVPSLQPPGAGLPKTELWVARLLLGWQARRATRDSSALRFDRERAAILNLVQAVDAKENFPRVLIKRPVGLEDCSRYWSVFMTLDHLRIVNHGTGKLIRLLARGETPEKVTGTKDVKPATGVGEEVVAEFQEACDFFQQCVASVTNLRTALKWPHPWFGPLDAADWHFLTAFHMGLHRHQIEAIRRIQRVSK
jgi:hypothetical protein